MKKQNNVYAIPTEKLLTIKEVAKETGLGIPFLVKAKAEYGLPFYRLGGGIRGSVRYRMSEVNKWILERQCTKMAV